MMVYVVDLYSHWCLTAVWGKWGEYTCFATTLALMESSHYLVFIMTKSG